MPRICGKFFLSRVEAKNGFLFAPYTFTFTFTTGHFSRDQDPWNNRERVRVPLRCERVRRAWQDKYLPPLCKYKVPQILGTPGNEAGVASISMRRRGKPLSGQGRTQWGHSRSGPGRTWIYPLKKIPEIRPHTLGSGLLRNPANQSLAKKTGTQPKKQSVTKNDARKGFSECYICL